MFLQFVLHYKDYVVDGLRQLICLDGNDISSNIREEAKGAVALCEHQPGSVQCKQIFTSLLMSWKCVAYIQTVYSYEKLLYTCSLVSNVDWHPYYLCAYMAVVAILMTCLHVSLV